MVGYHAQVRKVQWVCLRILQKFTEIMGMWATTAALTRVMGESALMAEDFDRAEKILKQGIELAARKKDPYQDLKAMTALDELYDRTREYEKRFQVLLRKLDVRKRLNDALGQAEDLAKITSGFLSRNMYDRALNYSQRALEVCPDSAPIQFQVHLRIHSASVFSYMGKVKQAEKLLLQAIDLAAKNHENSQVAFARHELGLLYVRNSQYDAASTSITEALKAIKGSNNEILEAIFLDDLGEIYILTKKYKKAIQTLQQALVRWRRNGNSHNAVTTAKKLARMLAKLKEFDTAFEMLGEMVKYCQMTGRYQAAEELKTEAKAIMKLSPDGQRLSSGFDRMVGDALASELSTKRPSHAKFDLLRLMKRKVTATTGEPSSADEREELPLKVYELSERYVKSIMSNLKKTKTK